MPYDTCDRTYACPNTCKIPYTSEISPLPTSLSTVQSHMPNRNFVVPIVKPVTVPFCFHTSALSCFTLNEAFDMLQKQETLYLGYTNFRSYWPFQLIKSNRSCRQGQTCELTLVHEFLPGMDCNIHRKPLL